MDDFGNIKDANDNVDINSSSNSFDANGDSSTGNLNTAPYAGYDFKARHYRNGELLGGKVLRAFDNRNGLHIRYSSG